jgi:hypothetical protein
LSAKRPAKNGAKMKVVISVKTGWVAKSNNSQPAMAGRPAPAILAFGGWAI